MGTRHVNSYLCRAFRQKDGKIVTTCYLTGVPHPDISPTGQLIAEETIQATDAATAENVFKEHLRNDKLAHDSQEKAP